MKKTLLILMAVALVGCDKKNPPKPENFTLSPRPEEEEGVAPDWGSLTKEEGKKLRADRQREKEPFNKKLEEWEKANKATAEWYNSLVVCLHCGSDLARKGAKVCPECLRPQRLFDPK
jgi:hypothetical protein